MNTYSDFFLNRIAQVLQLYDEGRVRKDVKDGRRRFSPQIRSFSMIFNIFRNVTQRKYWA